MKLRYKILLLSFGVLAFFSNACAQETTYPEMPKGYVNDYADIIDNDNELESKLESYENETTNELAIATIQSIGEVSIEEYAVTLFEKWGIGKQDKDNGVLLLVALEEKKVRIEVGYGLEGVIPDSIAGSIIRNEITPSFSEGDFSEGINRGVDALIASIGGEYSAEETDSPSNSGGIIFVIILAVVIIFIVIISRSGKSGGGYKSGGTKTNTGRSSFGGFSGRSSWGSSGGSSRGGGSFGGFGGGRSGGGGASGGW